MITVFKGNTSADVGEKLLVFKACRHNYPCDVYYFVALMTYPKHDHFAVDEALKQSYAGQIGTTLEPVIKPLGYDWRIGIGLIGSFAAREVFVSTMNIVFNIGGDQETTTLRNAFRQAKWPDGRPLFTPLVCVSLMVFFVFALQCMSTIAVVWRETGGWQWPLFQLIYMTVLAYCASFLVFHPAFAGDHGLGRGDPWDSFVLILPPKK